MLTCSHAIITVMNLARTSWSLKERRLTVNVSLKVAMPGRKIYPLVLQEPFHTTSLLMGELLVSFIEMIHSKVKCLITQYLAPFQEKNASCLVIDPAYVMLYN